MSIARAVVVEKVYLGEQGSGATRRPAPRWCHTPRHQRRQWTTGDGGRTGVGGLRVSLHPDVPCHCHIHRASGKSPAMDKHRSKKHICPTIQIDTGDVQTTT